MPRDPRPYLTYPKGYTGHPNLDGLSDAAFRAFHEMNDYSRDNGTDGVILDAIARKRWKAAVLAELVAGVPGYRPLVESDRSRFVLRSYAEHQMTKADVDDLARKRSEAGRKGGTAKASAVALASAAIEQDGNAEQAESKSEVDTYLLTPESLDPAARELDPDEVIGIRKALASFGASLLDDLGIATVTALLLEASPRPVGNRVGYVVRCAKRSPAKVRGLVAEAARQAAKVRGELGGAA